MRTLCQQCSAGCGITVRVMQGESIRTIDGQQKRVKAVQAKKIEGNPEHPISMGGTCARGQAGVQVLYHPDRIQTPLKLSGQRGSGQYQPITWKEAQQLLVTQLQQQQATPQAIALLTGRQKSRHDGHDRRAVRRRPRHVERRHLRSVRSRRRFARRWSWSPACRGCRPSTSRTRTTCCRSTRICSRRSSRLSATSIRTATCGRDGRAFAATSCRPSRVSRRRRRAPTNGCRSSRGPRGCSRSRSPTSSSTKSCTTPSSSARAPADSPNGRHRSANTRQKRSRRRSMCRRRPFSASRASLPAAVRASPSATAATSRR